MFRFKLKKKTGQVVIEFMVVLGLYFCLIGFMFSGFQIMQSKTTMNVAAYTGVRTSSLYGSSNSDGVRDATEIFKLNAFKGTDNPTVKVTTSGNYVTCIVSNKVKMLFPMIDPNNFTQVIGDKTLTSSFTMRKEKAR